jgi:hypothetical protein
MDADLRPTLVKLAIPIFTIVMILAITRRRGIAWKRDLGLVWPGPRSLLVWLAVWIGWMVLGEVVSRHFGFGQPSPWKPHAPFIVALRILAIGLCGPASEELFVRGILFFRLRATRLGPIGAILVCSAAWALMHYRYDPATIALIFFDGMVLGMARYRSDSTLLAILMHCLGNLYSIYQSLHG